MALAMLRNDVFAVPAPDAVIVKAGEYARFMEAEELVAAARCRAEGTVARAEAEADGIRTAAREEGLEAGKAEAAERIFEIATAGVEQLASMEQSLVDVVMRSLRTILGGFDDGELVTRVVSHALRLVRDEKRVRLRVATGDADAVRERLAGITAKYSGMGRVDVAADPVLPLGGCILETEVGVIDATLERQLRIIEETFRRHLEERAG